MQPYYLWRFIVVKVTFHGLAHVAAQVALALQLALCREPQPREIERGLELIARLQQEEIERTGISSLKMRFNSVFGYYIELTRIQAKNAPDVFIRKQTLKNAERYVTPELKEYEEKVLSAEQKARVWAVQYTHTPPPNPRRST